MPPNPPKHRCAASPADGSSKRESAFSLVEVVIAIGLISFAVLSLVGLLLTGLKSTRESGEDTSLAFCTETAQELLRAEGFSSASTKAAYAPGMTNPAFYFDSAGVIQTDTNGVPLASANSESLYGCTVTRRAPAVAPVQTTTNFLICQLKFVWPLTAPATNRQQRIVPMSLANYD